MYGSEPWQLRTDVRRLSVLEHRSLSSIGRVWWERLINNLEVRRNALGSRRQSFEGTSNLNGTPTSFYIAVRGR